MPLYFSGPQDSKPPKSEHRTLMSRLGLTRSKSTNSQTQSNQTLQGNQNRRGSNKIPYDLQGTDTTLAMSSFESNKALKNKSSNDYRSNLSPRGSSNIPITVAIADDSQIGAERRKQRDSNTQQYKDTSPSLYTISTGSPCWSPGPSTRPSTWRQHHRKRNKKVKKRSLLWTGYSINSEHAKRSFVNVNYEKPEVWSHKPVQSKKSSSDHRRYRTSHTEASSVSSRRSPEHFDRHSSASKSTRSNEYRPPNPVASNRQCMLAQFDSYDSLVPDDNGSGLHPRTAISQFPDLPTAMSENALQSLSSHDGGYRRQPAKIIRHDHGHDYDYNKQNNFRNVGVTVGRAWSLSDPAEIADERGAGFICELSAFSDTPTNTRSPEWFEQRADNSPNRPHYTDNAPHNYARIIPPTSSADKIFNDDDMDGSPVDYLDVPSRRSLGDPIDTPVSDDFLIHKTPSPQNPQISWPPSANSFELRSEGNSRMNDNRSDNMNNVTNVSRPSSVQDEPQGVSVSSNPRGLRAISLRALERYQQQQQDQRKLQRQQQQEREYYEVMARNSRMNLSSASQFNFTDDVQPPSSPLEAFVRGFSSGSAYASTAPELPQEYHSSTGRYSAVQYNSRAQLANSQLRGLGPEPPLTDSTTDLVSTDQDMVYQVIGTISGNRLNPKPLSKDEYTAQSNFVPDHSSPAYPDVAITTTTITMSSVPPPPVVAPLPVSFTQPLNNNMSPPKSYNMPLPDNHYAERSQPLSPNIPYPRTQKQHRPVLAPIPKGLAINVADSPSSSPNTYESAKQTSSETSFESATQYLPENTQQQRQQSSSNTKPVNEPDTRQSSNVVSPDNVSDIAVREHLNVTSSEGGESQTKDYDVYSPFFSQSPSPFLKDHSPPTRDLPSVPQQASESRNDAMYETSVDVAESSNQTVGEGSSRTSDEGALSPEVLRLLRARVHELENRCTCAEAVLEGLKEQLVNTVRADIWAKRRLREVSEERVNTVRLPTVTRNDNDDNNDSAIGGLENEQRARDALGLIGETRREFNEASTSALVSLGSLLKGMRSARQILSCLDKTEEILNKYSS